MICLFRLKSMRTILITSKLQFIRLSLRYRHLTYISYSSRIFSLYNYAESVEWQSNKFMTDVIDKQKLCVGLLTFVFVIMSYMTNASSDLFKMSTFHIYIGYCVEQMFCELYHPQNCKTGNIMK